MFKQSVFLADMMYLNAAEHSELVTSGVEQYTRKTKIASISKLLKQIAFFVGFQKHITCW